MTSLSQCSVEDQCTGEFLWLKYIQSILYVKLWALADDVFIEKCGRLLITRPLCFAESDYTNVKNCITLPGDLELDV